MACSGSLAHSLLELKGMTTTDYTGRSFGSYLLGPRLGAGGMAEIHSAVRRGMRNFAKPLAIKVLRPELAADASLVDAFFNEARVAAAMSHPNVVQVFDVGEEQGRFFMAMELVRGITLATLIDALRSRFARLPGHLISYIGREICEGLHHAHELVDAEGRPLGIIHRDVTPHNVLLSLDGRVKLTDFGIARCRDIPSSTRKGTVKGTLEYVSPEQVRGKELDRRVDIYSAAITLFTLATSESVYWRGEIQATVDAIQNAPLPDLSAIRPDLPLALVASIVRAAQKAPDRRFPTAATFRDSLPAVSERDCARELGQLVAALYQDEVRPTPPSDFGASVEARLAIAEQPTVLARQPKEAVAECDEVPTVAMRPPARAAPEQEVPTRIRRGRPPRPFWAALAAAGVLLSGPGVRLAEPPPTGEVMCLAPGPCGEEPVAFIDASPGELIAPAPACVAPPPRPRSIASASSKRSRRSVESRRAL